LLRNEGLLQRIGVRHLGLTKHRTTVPTGSTSAPFQLPIPPGAPLPTAHLSQKDQLGVTKILSEWSKVEALQEEKIKLAERLERITTRARERGRAEWTKVGGMDLEDVERDGKVAVGGFAELGSSEVLLPPGGLGSGMDGRQQKSESLRYLS
jgi:chromatin modification-related protein YNG2